MWIKVTTGNHYGIFEVVGVELYKESDDSYILYGYLPRYVPHVPVGIDRPLKEGRLPHIDFVKLHEYRTEQEAKDEIGRLQDFLDSGATGVYEMGEYPKAA